jgi:hypothetical protein
MADRWEIALPGKKPMTVECDVYVEGGALKLQHTDETFPYQFYAPAAWLTATRIPDPEAQA